MSFARKIAPGAVWPIAALVLVSGCAPTFEARVARFTQLPPPSGQSFVIEARNAEDAGGLEFLTYANLVKQRLVAHGFTEAASASEARMTVKLDYTVGQPREKIQTRPGFGGFGGYGWGPYWGGFGRFGGFGYGGFNNGFGGFGGFGGGFNGPEVYSVTQYNSALAMKIVRNADKASMFEGRAETVSTSNNLTQLVPNLVTAIFTNFPGNSGETVRVKFDPAQPGKAPTVRAGR